MNNKMFHRKIIKQERKDETVLSDNMIPYSTLRMYYVRIFWQNKIHFTKQKLFLRTSGQTGISRR